MKVFISQPMNGRTEEEIVLARQEVIERIIKEYGHDVEILNSYFNDGYRQSVENDLQDTIKHTGLFWLSQALELLAGADILWVCEGWQYSRGCPIEIECAKAYGVKVEFDTDYITKGE